VVPFTPKTKRDAAFALAISLGLALALAFGLERFDRRIKSADEVAEAYGVPLLSVIPHASSVVDTRDPDGKAAVPTALREAFRSLRTNVQLASLERPVKRILVASAISGEGKSMIIRNLALTYREWGLSVAVFEADLRRPSLRRYFGLEPGNDGLTSVLTGDLDIEDVLIDIEVDVASLDYLDKVRDVRAAEPRPPSGATTAHSSRFVLLPGGETPPNPQAVLAAEKTSQVLEWLSERFDVVLIDTPPLLAVTDAIPLLPLSDGVVLVTRLGKTEHGSGRRTVALAQLDPSVTVLGVVANDLPIQSGYGYGYGYYGQEYALTSNHNHKAPKTES
jgi:Mrp family chromosome partitioning ATPase